MPRLRPIPASLQGAPGPVSTRQAQQAGLPARRLRTRRWRRVMRGYYLPRRMGQVLWRHRALALLDLYPDAVLSVRTAAALWLGEPPELLLEVIIAPQRRCPRRPWLSTLRTPLKAADTRIRSGYRVTTPVRTAFDCARLLPLLDAVAEVDALLHAGLVTRAQLARYVTEHPRLRGIPQARRVLQMCNPDAESRMESRTRVVLVLAGIPAPEVNVTLYDGEGKFLGRVDLLWRDARFIVEYEGDHHRDPKQYRADLARRYRMERAGYRVLPITAADVYKRPEELVATVRAELAERTAPTRRPA